MALRQDKFTVVGLGELLWDLLPEGKQVGGAPANFVYHVTGLGAQGRIVSSIGQDDLGQEMLTRLKEKQIDTSYVHQDPDHETGTVSIVLDKAGKPDYVIHEDMAWDFIPYGIALDHLAAEADAVCFGTLGQRSAVSRDTIQRFLQATKPTCFHVFDINLRQSFYTPELILVLLKHADILKLNDEELPVLAYMLKIPGHQSDVLGVLQQTYQLKMIVLTKGAEGSVLYTPDCVSTCQAPADLKIVDTVGAGDAFTAAVTMGVLKGQDLDTIHKSANQLAAYVCTQQGAMPSIPR